MPRKRQATTQPIKEIPNQPYGMGQDLTEMQQQVPLPKVGVNNIDIPPAGAVGPPTQEDTLRHAQEFEGPLPTPLGAPSTRPQEPVTTGLSTGKGAGREALYGHARKRNPRADILDMLAATSNDPKLAKMAQRARMTR